MPVDCIPTERAATRTPEPPDRDEHENSPPRLLRPKRSTNPPKNYAQEQERETKKRNARPQQRKKNQDRPATQRDAPIAEDSATESEDLGPTKLVEELVKLRREIRRRDDLHKEELKKVKEEFSAALVEVR
uniref:Uncharacterized protein n=1 Tax=Talaromyces marneffei PM1 TaxID=1077442 RepID=A0A093Y6E5_TALMA